MKKITPLTRLGIVCTEMKNSIPNASMSILRQSTGIFSRSPQNIARVACRSYSVKMCNANQITRTFDGLGLKSCLYPRHDHLSVLKLLKGTKQTLLKNSLTFQSCILTFKVNFSSRSSATQIDYYAVLGVGKAATNEEIKSAYYKLSKVYHPDRNKGSEEAAAKFHAVSTAYEILGNYKLRKMYDKGFLTAEYVRHKVKVEEGPPIEHEAFYRSRSQRSNVPEVDDTPNVYDVDQWTKALHEKQRIGLKTAKERSGKKVEAKRAGEFITNLEYLLLFGIVTVAVILLVGWVFPPTATK